MKYMDQRNAGYIFGNVWERNDFSRTRTELAAPTLGELPRYKRRKKVEALNL